MKKNPMRSLLSLIFVIVLGAVAAAQDAAVIQLPKPDTEGGRPLMQVLRSRRSAREFREDKIPLPVLSNLLWAAFGVNREDGRRTAPSARNWQEIDIYVATAEGVYLYEAKENTLRRMLGEDIRPITGTQPYVVPAPVNLVYVADFARMENAPATEKPVYAGTDTGFIAQNVYLYCASEGLATVVRASIDKKAFAGKLKLRADQQVTLAQTVGYPKN